MSTNIIKINRGDSFNFKLSVSKYFKNDYRLSVDEIIYFALLLPHQKFEDALILRGYTLEDQDSKTGEISIDIFPNDTKLLPPGVYYYTVKYQKGGTLLNVEDLDTPIEAKTLIERTKFIITE